MDPLQVFEADEALAKPSGSSVSDDPKPSALTPEFHPGAKRNKQSKRRKRRSTRGSGKPKSWKSIFPRPLHVLRPHLFPSACENLLLFSRNAECLCDVVVRNRL